MMILRPRRLLAAALAGCAIVATVSAQSPDPAFLGTWKVNQAKSDVSQTRLAFTAKPSGEITMTIQGTSYDFRMDGQPHPAPFSSTATWTETSPRSWRTLYRMNNMDNNIDNYTLSDDGRTLTMRTEILVPARSEQTMTFTRVGSGDGLIGTWQGRSLQAAADQTMTLTADGGKIRLHLLPIDASALLSPDGVEAPVTGPPAAIPPGMTVGLKITGPRTFDLALTDSGKPIFLQHATLSDDGRTLTVDSVNGPPGPTQDHTKIVYEKQ
jgi:hypothetical protein